MSLKYFPRVEEQSHLPLKLLLRPLRLGLL
jgi:hypothetical protein